MIPKSWLNRKMSIDRAEAWQSEWLEQDPTSQESVLSDWTPAWRDFLARKGQGDDLWLYQRPNPIGMPGWDIGFALVREDEILAAIIWSQAD